MLSREPKTEKMSQIISIRVKTAFLRDFLLHEYGVEVKGRRVVVIKSSYVNREIMRNVTILAPNQKASVGISNGFPIDIWLPIHDADVNVSVSKSGNLRISRHLYDRLFHPIFCNKIDILLMHQCKMVQTAIELFMHHNGIEYNDRNFEALKRIYLRRNTAYHELINESLGRRYSIEPTFQPIYKGKKKKPKVDYLQGRLEWEME